MDKCPYCQNEGGKHTPKCPLNPTVMNHNVPIIGQQPEYRPIPSRWFCPNCNYNPPTVDHPEAKGLPITQTVLVNQTDGADVAMCPVCWARFVAAHTHRLVKREADDGTTEA